MVTDTGGIDDRSFNQLAWAGMRAAAKGRRNVNIRYLQSTTVADYLPNIDSFISSKCRIIVTIGSSMAIATEDAAKADPKQKFAIVDCAYADHCLTGKKLKNIRQIAFNTVQDGFLGGYLAAGMSKTHTVATFGGQRIDPVTIYMDGFWDGVHYYNSQHHTSITVLGWNERTQKGRFIGNFTSPAAGQTLTASLVHDGADVIFPVAGGANLGAAQAVQAADGSGKSAAIEWPDTDGCFSVATYCKYSLTSVTKGITSAVKAVALAAIRGKFAQTYIGTLASGGVALAPYHDFAKKVPASLQAEINKVKSEIETGKITPATKSPV
jgi:basic membrane protein A and related proteins